MAAEYLLYEVETLNELLAEFSNNDTVMVLEM